MYMKSLPSEMPANEARINFYKMIEEAGENMRQFIVTHRGKPPVIFMSVAEFEGWQETLEIMADKKLMVSIGRALKSKKTFTQIQADKLIGW